MKVQVRVTCPECKTEAVVNGQPVYPALWAEQSSRAATDSLIAVPDIYCLAHEAPVKAEQKVELT